MGKVMSMISRKVNRFNVESRAHRVLERDKPVPAPKYESNLRDMERAIEADPDVVEKINRKDDMLHNRLKSVYVTSKDSFIDYKAMSVKSDDRALPLDRKTPEDFLYGFQEPRKVRPGRCTLSQALQFISDHQRNPEEWTAKKIAEEYKLKEVDVGHILKYFRPFELHIPNKNVSEKVLRQSEPQPEMKLPKDKVDKDSV